MDQLFFTETAQLRDEFEALYATLFKRPENYLKVIECLSDGRRSGMTRDEILKESKLSDGGTFSTILEELEESGFIRRFASADTAETNALYQLIPLRRRSAIRPMTLLSTSPRVRAAARASSTTT